MKFALASLFAVALLFTGCATGPSGGGAARSAMLAAIPNEVPGDYYIGRRYYKKDYRFWGWVRKPRQPWTSAQLVMLNEQQKLAPDREKWDIGGDNDQEYKLYGYFSGDKVYEPASNGFYSEFVLRNIELVDAQPAPIFRRPDTTNPALRRIEQPY